MVQSIDRAIGLLDILARSDHPIGLKDISEAVEVPTSTARRLLVSLMSHGFVNQNEKTRLYTPGLRLIELAYEILGSLDLRTQAEATLDYLNMETSLTVHLGIFDCGDVVYLDKREAKDVVRMHSAVGKRAPVHCSALGKALVAFKDEAELRRIVGEKGLPRYTKTTITTWDDFIKDLKLVRELGYSRDNAEHQDMVHCIGAPIRDHTGVVVASISLTGTVYSHEIHLLDRFASLLMQQAIEISKKLGYIDTSLGETNKS